MTEEEQQRRRHAIDSKLREYRELNTVAKKGQCVFAGSSLMQLFPLNELLMDHGLDIVAYNRGVLSLTVREFAEVLDICVLDLKPTRLFINIGTNDLGSQESSAANMLKAYRELILRIQRELPECRITMMAYYPCIERGVPNERKNAIIDLANKGVEAMAAELGCRFINVNAPITDENGWLRSDIAMDTVHFTPAGYIGIMDELVKYLD